MGRVLSGIQPTGELHIGNYLGAIRNWVAIQQSHECIFSIVDYHAITIDYSVRDMPGRVMDLAAGLIACGIDPERAALFIQSEVIEHTELAWVFNSVTPMGELQRQTQFKSKAEHNPENINVGLFTYPVLQTADILLYKATLIPVGQDQEQHLELSREIARKFNARYGPIFPEAKTMFTSTPKILGLDGKAKMSKSLNNTIAVDDDEKTIQTKLSKAFTDPNRLRKSDPGNPDICNVFTLHKFFTDPEQNKQIDRDCRSAALGCVDCKKMLGRTMSEHLQPIRERWAKLRSDAEPVHAALDRGKARCQEIAHQTMSEVKTAMGLSRNRSAKSITKAAS